MEVGKAHQHWSSLTMVELWHLCTHSKAHLGCYIFCKSRVGYSHSSFNLRLGICNVFFFDSVLLEVFISGAERHK